MVRVSLFPNLQVQVKRTPFHKETATPDAVSKMPQLFATTSKYDLLFVVESCRQSNGRHQMPVRPNTLLAVTLGKRNECPSFFI